MKIVYTHDDPRLWSNIARLFRKPKRERTENGICAVLHSFEDEKKISDDEGTKAFSLLNDHYRPVDVGHMSMYFYPCNDAYRLRRARICDKIARDLRKGINRMKNRITEWENANERL